MTIPTTSRRYRLLGGLEVIEEPGRLELGTRKQRALLGILLLAEGRPVSSDRLVEAIWGGSPPDRVEASLQSYVSTLRRVLEPDRAPRAPARVLVTNGTGYALRAARDQVDAWRFADLIEEGRAHRDEHRPAEAATTLRNALAMYAPLLPEFEHEAFTRSAGQHLERLHLVALELSYEVRLELGEHHVLVADLESAVQRHPLHEGLWALLAIARYRTGRQSEALRAVADAKRLLADEIGVDAGPRLRQVEADLLAQAPHLDPPATPHLTRPVTLPAAPAETRPPVRHVVPADVPATVLAAPPTSRPDARGAAAPDDAGTTNDPLVGRDEELAVLHRAITGAAAGGEALVLIEGEPGAGKTRLLEEAFARASATMPAAQVLWGRCLDGGGSPGLWPWVQIMNAVQPLLTPQEREVLPQTDMGRIWLSKQDATGALPALPEPDAGARFRLYGEAGRLMDAVAGRQPIVIVIDDLQWADRTSLELFVHLAARRPGRVLMIAAMRDRAPGPDEDLRQALAALSRLPGHRRISLGPLAEADVAEMVRRQTGTDVDAAVLASIRTRSAGNPFFVRELARLADGDLSGVPASVRDVVRDRVERAGAPGKELLQIAALIGRDVDLGLLARAADLDVEATLSRLEPAEEVGLLAQHPHDPFSFRFEHDIVRESIAETTPPLRAVRLHLRIADALEAAGSRDDVVERVAEHLWQAGPLAAPPRTARALFDAAKVAVGSLAYDSAERHLESAAAIARTGGDEELELDVVSLLTSVLGVQQGYHGAALELMQRAENLATRLGRDRQAGDFLYSRWAAHTQRLELDQSSRLAARLREAGAASSDPVLKLYGNHAWGIDQWDHGNVGEAFRSLSQNAHGSELDAVPGAAGSTRAQDALRTELQLLGPAFLAALTVVHGDLAAGRARFEAIDAAVETPYARVVWGAFAALAGALAGDAEWVRKVTRRCIAEDPDLHFTYFGSIVRLFGWWAAGLLGDAEQACEQVERTLRQAPAGAPRTGQAAWLALQAELYLAAGRIEDAGTALTGSERSMGRLGQMYPEPLVLLVRARWRHARGDSDQDVAATLEAVRSLARAREAFLFVDRADRLAEQLGLPVPT